MNATKIRPDEQVELPRRMSAVEVMVLAADGYDRPATKWELAVSAWKIDPSRFGMRGFESIYPDMNRVMVELVKTRPGNATGPVNGYVEKVGKNLYRITPLGRSVAARVRDRRRCEELYDRVLCYAEHQEFVRWMDNPEEPRTKPFAVAFLFAAHSYGLNTISDIRRIIADARAWLIGAGVTHLTRATSYSDGMTRRPLGLNDLAALDDFCTALEYRFPGLSGAGRNGKS